MRMHSSKTTDTAHRGASLNASEIASWHPFAGSADSDLLPELGTLVSRSRDLVRNHGVASGAIQTLTDNIVGTGLRLAARPDYIALGKTKEWADDWARHVEAHFRTWAESTSCDAANSLTFSGLMIQVFRSALLNGEALALPLWLPDKHDTSGFATTLQLIEPDRLSNPNGEQDSDRLRSGIEINQYGAPVAYWIKRTHPGDVFTTARDNEWQRIPATTKFGRQRVLHLHDKERTGQTRGKPLLSSVLPLFKTLDRYERSELQAAVVNAMIAAFVESPLDNEGISDLFGGDLNEYMKARGQWRLNLKSGAIIPVFPGDKVSSFTPSRPNSGYGQFVENVLRHIGAGLNLPFELLMKDFSKTNYSSARASLMEAGRFFAGRRQWLSTYWARPVYALWLEEAVNKGIIEAPTFYQQKQAWTRSKWIGAGRGWIDPVKEATASQIRMEIGLSTLEEECAAQGSDWEEVLEQRAREQAKQHELGLVANDNATMSPDKTNVPNNHDDKDDSNDTDDATSNEDNR